MFKSKFLIPIFLCTLFFSACGGGSSSSTDNGKNTDNTNPPTPMPPAPSYESGETGKALNISLTKVEQNEIDLFIRPEGALLNNRYNTEVRSPDLNSYEIKSVPLPNPRPPTEEALRIKNRYLNSDDIFYGFDIQFSQKNTFDVINFKIEATNGSPDFCTSLVHVDTKNSKIKLSGNLTIKEITRCDLSISPIETNQKTAEKSIGNTIHLTFFINYHYMDWCLLNKRFEYLSEYLYSNFNSTCVDNYIYALNATYLGGNLAAELGYTHDCSEVSTFVDTTKFGFSYKDQCPSSNFMALKTMKNLKTITSNDYPLITLNGIEYLKSLENLSIHGSNITDTSPLKTLTNLKIIDLPANKITNLTGLYNKPNITDVNLNENKIYYKPPMSTENLNPLIDLIKDMWINSTKINPYRLTFCMNPIYSFDFMKALTSLDPPKGYFTLNFLDDIPFNYGVRVSDCENQIGVPNSYIQQLCKDRMFCSDR